MSWEGVKGLGLLPSSPEAVIVKSKGQPSPRPRETQATLLLWHLNAFFISVSGLQRICEEKLECLSCLYSLPAISQNNWIEKGIE